MIEIYGIVVQAACCKSVLISQYSGALKQQQQQQQAVRPECQRMNSDLATHRIA